MKICCKIVIFIFRSWENISWLFLFSEIFLAQLNSIILAFRGISSKIAATLRPPFASFLLHKQNAPLQHFAVGVCH